MLGSPMKSARTFVSTAAFLGCSLIFCSASGAADLRPIAPTWQELDISSQENGATVVRSRAGTESIALRLGGKVEVLQKDRPYFKVDDREIALDHLTLVDVWRNKSAEEALAAYRDYVNADLKRRGWRELTAERTKISAGAGAPALYWASQADVTSAGKPVTLTTCMAAALVGSNIVAMTGIAEDAQGAKALKRYLAEAFATLERKTTAALSGEDIARLRSEAQSGGDRRSSGTGAMLLNDELASAEDREGGNGDTQHYILSPSDMIEAAALAAAGSRNGLFMTFVNDGRSQHTFLITDYDPATAMFTYSDTTGQHSLLEAGNNLAGVEAVPGPGGWQVKKDQLKTVLSAMIVGKAEVAKASGIVHFGPFGAFGNTPDDAKATDFFTWFHLTETGRSGTPGGGTTISYGPDSAKFRPLVTVRLNLAPAGWIRGADIVLKRRFIELANAADEANARDIAKSFIASSVVAADTKTIRSLQDEIFYLGSGQMLVGSKQDISIPVVPTDGYLAFAGRREYFMDYLSQSRLWMENVVADGEPALLISIGPAS